jgi:hypothetical protein
MNWFQVDIAGLAKILADRPKSFIVNELVANALDSKASEIDVSIQPGIQPGRVTIKVTDDDPEGFANLAHAYTLFAESCRKSNPEKRGRFNLGEKLVLAVSENATITTTTGQINFSKKGRSPGRRRRERGSEIEVTIKCTKAEFLEDLLPATSKILPRPGCVLRINGEPVPERKSLRFFSAVLPTVSVDDEGCLRASKRKTLVGLVECINGETPMLYELGIPVVEIDGDFHVNVGQKVPLNTDRDNVTPAYLRKIRVETMNAAHDMVRDCTQHWVREAIAQPECSPDAVRVALTRRFGEAAVAFDASDLEANKRATGMGMTIVHGGSLSAGEWQSARRAGMLTPAGQVTPSPKPYSKDGKPLQLIPPEEWTMQISSAVAYARRFARHVIDREITVQVVHESDWPFSATYGPSGQLTLNVASIGHANFIDREYLTDLFIHEFGHEYAGDHLSSDYHEALTKIAAKAVTVALNDPSVFNVI